MAGTPHEFDRQKVEQQVNRRLNELWQDMVSNRHAGWFYTSPSTITLREALEAAQSLRGQLDRAMQDIGALCGTAGEYLDPEEFIAGAVRTFNEVVVPHSRKIGCPPEKLVAPYADPNWCMAQFVLDVWNEQFFGPQRENGEKMLAGLVAAAQFNKEAARPADNLLRRLRRSTLKRFDSTITDLLGEVIQFLQIYMPEEAKKEELSGPLGEEQPEQAANTSANASTDGIPPEQQVEIFEQLEPAIQKAYLSYEYAESKVEKKLQDRDAYEYLNEYGVTSNEGDLGDLTDYLLPAFNTWSRQLRSARHALREQKYTSRAGRPSGSSVVRSDEI